MKHHFIINPTAGKGNLADALKQKIISICNDIDIKYYVHTTVKPLDATEYVKNALVSDEDEHRFYACGGDGTLSEVLNGTDLSNRAQIALIPIGTGNDFWKNFDNGQFFSDINRQIEGEPRKIDVLTYNGKYCANMINIGFDCDVVKKSAKLKRHFWIPSKMAYIFGVICTLFKKMGKRMHIEFDDGTVIDKPLLLTAVANGQFCGGGYDAAPLAKLNDGLMDLCIINKVSRLTFLKLISSYRAGTHLETTKGKQIIEYFQRRHVRYTFDKDTDICIDGEIETCRTLELGIIRNAIKFSIPKGCKIIDKSDSKTRIPAE